MGLEVNASKGPSLLVEGDIGLHDTKMDAVILKLPLTPRPGEEPAKVFPLFGFDNKRSLYLGLGDDHAKLSALLA
jgi:hypothetical protein